MTDAFVYHISTNGDIRYLGKRSDVLGHKPTGAPQMSDWSDRIDAATAAFKARLKPEQPADPGSEAARALASLEQVRTDLEMDLTRVLKQVSDLTSRAAMLEQRAMQAIQKGDDAAARQALVEHGSCTDELAQLEADVAAVRASIEQCRVVEATQRSPSL